MAIEKKFVREQVNRLLIKEFLKKETERAGFGGLDIQRTPMGTRVSLVVERPGMVIGRRGATIQKLTADLSRNFEAENPQIEVVEAGRNANLNANIMAAKVAEALERGWHFRRAGHSTVRRIMESGAKGVIVILSGKLTGQRHRMEKFIAGHIKYNGDTAIQLMDVGYAQCKKKLGTIGCTVKIMHPDARLPDEVEIFAPGEKGRVEAPEERTEPVDEKPAVEEAIQEEAETKAAESKEAEDKPRRPRRREPQPQPTEADLAEAKALAQKRKAKKAEAPVHVTKGEGPEEGKEPEAKAEDAGEAPSQADTDAAVEAEGAAGGAQADAVVPAETEATKAAEPATEAKPKAAPKAEKKAEEAKPQVSRDEPKTGEANKKAEPEAEPKAEPKADAKEEESSSEAESEKKTKEGDAE